MFLLVDGIYPSYSRFVKGISEPLDEQETVFTEWQEKARKDIERAFGVLQASFQFVTRPIHLFRIKDIAARIGTCILLHNMCVADRVMEGDVMATYFPGKNNGSYDETDQNPESSEEVEEAVLTREQFTRKRWVELDNKVEYNRLHHALMRQINSKK